MRIVIIGAGNVSGALVRSWSTRDHDLIVAARDVDKAKSFVGPRVQVATIDDALAVPCDVVVIAITGAALAAFLSTHGRALDGRLIIDATNLMGADRLHQLPLLQEHLPAATITRAFNTVGWDVMAQPFFDGVPADLPYIAAGGEDRSIVASLIRDTGMRPVWIGGLDQADTLDGFTRAWFALVFARGLGRHLAFKVMADVPVDE